MDLVKTSSAIILATALLGVSLSGVATGRTVEIAAKGRANANTSVAASGQFAALAWGASTKDGMTDVYVATSRDGGLAFGAPTRVNQVAGDASLSGEQPPRVALVPRAGRDPSIVVVWTAKASAGTRLMSARSEDGGKSFAAAIPVPGSDASGNRGWESTATNRDGEVLALWLDHRELATAGAGTAAMAHMEHQHAASGEQKADGVARAQLSKLFFGRLNAPASARALVSGVCYCCKTSIATGSDGAVYAVWRHVYPGNVRDIAFTMSSNDGQTFAPPIRVSEDQWAIDGCPENGPALAVDASRRIHVVWPTLVPGAARGSEPTLALFYAMSRDGRQFTPRQRIPTEGFPRHPQIALGTHGEIVVAWDEQAGGTRIALARGTIDGNGTVRLVRQAIGDGAPAVYPVVATAGDGAIVAWTSGATGQTVIRAERLTNETGTR